MIDWWPHGVFAAMRGPSPVAECWGYSLLSCMVFSLLWFLLLRSMGSRRVAFSSRSSWALEYRLSSCGERAQFSWGMWDLPGPGMEPMFTALAGYSLLLSHQGSPFWTIFEGTFSGGAQNSQFIPHKTLHTLWGCFMYPSFISSVTVSI